MLKYKSYNNISVLSSICGISGAECVVRSEMFASVKPQIANSESNGLHIQPMVNCYMLKKDVGGGCGGDSLHVLSMRRQIYQCLVHPLH
jgi:hypothetical protein